MESTINSTFKNKLQKVLQLNLDSEDTLLAFNDLSSFYDNNTIDSRWNLCAQLEKRCITVNEEFLQAFSQIQKELAKVQESVDDLQNACTTMEQKIASTKSVSGKLIEQADKLFTANNRNTAQTELIASFLSHFQLTTHEVKVLRSPDINKEFFDALARVNAIRNDCKILLRTQHQRAGLEIMDAMSEHLEGAYRKLYRWVRGECKLLEVDAPELDHLFISAFVALRDRPVLLSYCLEEVGSTRSRTLVKSFIQALTQGGPSGMPRPIDLQAHEPRRYVGDMAAWIHQAVASEDELINTLLGTQSSLSSDEERQKYEENLQSVLHAAFSGVARPFKARFDQVLATKPGTVATYQLANLVDFYGRRFENLMGADSDLFKTFSSCKNDALKAFFEHIKKNTDKRKRTPPIPPTDLSPPHELQEVTASFVEIASTFDSSLVPNEERENEFMPIIENLVDPLFQAIQLGITKLGKIEQNVYLINCYSAIQVVLMKYVFTATKVQQIVNKIEELLNALVTEQTSIILKYCGLFAKAAIIKQEANSGSKDILSRVSGMETLAVKSCLRSFDSSLLDFGSLSMPIVDRIVSSKLRLDARSRVTNTIIDAYSILYNAVMDPKNGYENPLALFRYKPEQVRTMISL
jgi:hypothetical protein